MAQFRLTPPVVKISENDVEQACLDLLRVRHFYPLRQHSGLFKTPDKKSRYIHIGQPGIPDYVIPRYFVEVKRSGGTLSEVQKEKIRTLKEHWDLETAVVESVDELIEWLAQHPH
jgi:hypothetical protein